MGKNPQNGTEKSQKNVKSAPSWRSKLEEYDLNSICEGRTCEVILMAELTIFFSEAIRLFHAGANNNPTNLVKSINFECFASDMKQAGQAKEKPEKTKSKSDPTAALFQAATAEALQYLNASKSIPVELIAHLLKLKIINMINEDVILRDEERMLEIEKLKLASETADKKGKADKGKAEKGAENKKPKGKTSNVKLPMEERCLYFLISGIYEPSLVEELYKIGIPLRAILELSSPECAIFKEKYAERSETPVQSNLTVGNSLISNTATESVGEDEEIVLFINQFYAGSKESVCYSAFGGEQSISSITSSIQEKITSLNIFWNKMYEELEGRLQAKCLESAAHVRIQPLSASHEDKSPQEVFLEISKPIIKLSDIKRQHLNYLRKLKLCKIDSEPKDFATTSLKTYRKLIDVVPSDCCTIGLVLYCLVEEVCARVSDPKPHRSVGANTNLSKCPIESKSIPNSSADVKTKPNRDVPVKPKNEPEQYGKSIKELASYVIQCRKNYSPLVKCGITYRQYKFEPKLKLKISKEPFVIHETNWLEYKLSTYQELSKLLLKININVLKKGPAALLWNNYPQLETIEVVYKNHQLETWRHLLNLSKNDMHCALSAIQFDLLSCSNRGKIVPEPKNSIQMLFPEKNESDVLKAATPHVKYIQTPDISLTSLNERESGLRIPEVPYSDTPNMYEAKNIPAYLWYETLPHEVMLQQLQKANSRYVCVDHKYCPYNDALILRYHNNVDTFGINSKIWTQFLRTPVCFRDFCKYVLHEEAQWLENEEDDYQVERKALKKPLILSEATDRRTSTKKLSIRPGSSKVSNQETSQGRKTSSKKLSAQCVNPVETNQITSKSQRTSIKNLSTQSKKPKDSCSFLAYDLGIARIQLTGATTIFHSMDGYKVIVDRTSLIGRPNKLSVNVALAGHNVILHCNGAALNEPFMFHFCLSDGTILVFAKPTPIHKAEISVAEKSKISEHKPKMDSNSAYQPREKKYFCVTEITRWYLKTVKMPTVARKSLLLDEDFMPIFLEQMKKNLVRPIRPKIKRKFRSSFPEKCFVENVPTPENPKEVLTLYVSPTVQTSSLKMEELTSGALKAQKEQIEILKKIEEARKLQIPLFKVYSSKLHKFEYIRRVKSRLHITVGRHTISLPCKHRMYKVSREIEVVKVAPVKLTDAMFYNNGYYDMKMSLPSGLLIYTLAGVNNHAFNIRQKYVEKNPYCKNVANEDSRTFMRSGNVVVKKNDGTLDIYSASGEIIHCEIPHSTVHTHTKYKLKTKRSSEGNQKLRLTKLESKLCRIVNWRRRHIIGGPESRHFKYRRKNIRQHKLQAKHSNNVYVMHEGSNPLFEFTLITHDGKQLKVTNTRVRKQDQFFQTTLADEYYDENINLRDDGTTHMIYGGGIFTTQFNDKTKISSWFAESPEMIIIDDDDSLFEKESLGSYLYEQVSDNGWIFIEMFYKFEHPNYATILYSKDNYETEINLPNHVIINVTENGHYFLDVDGTVSSVINEELVYLESKTCDTCMQRSITVLNIKPLYDGTHPIEENTELLKTCDSYEKIFLVKYNGKCFRNSNYVKYRTNRAHCSQHDKEDHQQLFVLNRDLSGSKFWDVKAYRERVIQATSNNTTVLQYYGQNTKIGDYASLEFRTYKYKPYHVRFMNESMNDDLVLSSNCRNESNPPPAFTTLCHIHTMPKECMTKLLETTMMESSKQKAEFPKSDHQNIVCKCTSQIVREMAKLKGKSVFDEHLAKISSALLLRKKWCSWHELNKPYVPLQQTCKCKSDSNKEKLKAVQLPKITRLSFDENPTPSVEIMPDRSASESVIESHMEPHKTVCECNIPASFVCKCKKSFDASECTEMETPEGNSEANHRIASINDWSNEVDFLDDFYIFSEKSMSTSDEGGMSVSNTIIQEKEVKPPPYKYNTDKNINQRPIAPKHRPRKICTKDTCSERPKASVKVSRSSTNSELPSRQAGGADLPANCSNIRKIHKGKTQEENVSKAVCRKIIEIVLASNMLAEVSSERAEHCKIAVAINIMGTVSQAHLSTSQLLYFLQNLNDLDINQHKIFSAQELSCLILSLSKNSSKNVTAKSKIMKHATRTIKATKHKQDLK